MCKSLADRFWAKVGKGAGCWTWTGAKQGKGYGSLRTEGGTMLAHRFSYELAYGPIPTGEGYHGTCCLHKCDNPACVRPDHLFLGTNADNMADMVAKGRSPDNKGVNNPRAKLSIKDVRAVRAFLCGGISQTAVAQFYGVSIPTISRIHRKKAWA